MKKVAALLALVLAAFALVACGDDDDNGTTAATSDNGAETTTETGGEEAGGGNEEEGGAGGTREPAKGLSFEADPDGALAYTTKLVSTAAGKVTVEFENPQSVPHDVAIEDSSGKTIGKTEVITAGSTSTTVELKPADYTFYCSVPGHREAGMEGTVTAH